MGNPVSTLEQHHGLTTSSPNNVPWLVVLVVVALGEGNVSFLIVWWSCCRCSVVR
jgi:hypothetical protein